MPRTPSLELSVLPSGVGQSTQRVYCHDLSTDETLLLVRDTHKFTFRAISPHGAEGDRTPDLCLAKAALSQLSYSPAWIAFR